MRTQAKALIVAAALLAGWPALAQPSDADKAAMDDAKAIQDLMKDSQKQMDAAPASPNGLPMEAEWEYAPEAPNGAIGDKPGPWLVSRWGNIVVRGRREGDKIVSAYNTVQCGRTGDRATRVTVLGQPPADICAGIEAIADGESRTSVSKDGAKSFGTADGWMIVDFAQRIDKGGFSGLPAASTSGPPRVGLTSNGAFYLDQGGRHVFYAPGETVEVAPGTSILVRPVMTPDEIDGESMQQALDKAGQDSAELAKETDRLLHPVKAKPPTWFYLLFFGIPLGLVGGLIYWVRQRLTRRRGALPALSKAELAAIPLGTSYADAVRAKNAPFEKAASEQGTDDLRPSGKAVDRLRTWRALDPKVRRNVFVGAGVLLAAALFLIFRPSSDPTTVLRKLEAGTKSGAAPIEQGTLLVEETLTADILTDGKLVSPAGGHKARFAWYRPDDIKILFDTFSSASDAEAAMKNIRAHGPEEVLLLPASARGAATPYSDTSPVPFRPEMTEECRNTAAYLYCMVAPDNTRVLVTVRLPADPVVPIPGVANANSRAKDALRGAIDRLREAGVGT